MMAKKPRQISHQQIENSILFLRGEKVLLDSDLAELYGVTTKALNQAVKRNLTRFPHDFMFRLTVKETSQLNRSQTVTGSPKALRSQIVTLKTGRGQHRKYLPYAFTEQGVAMLSSVLRSQRAVQVNIEIMRAFVRLRRILAVNAELGRRLDEVESHLGKHDEQFIQVVRAIRQLMEPPASPKRPGIGFHQPRDEPSADARVRRAKGK
jgi:hypothetical protein